MGLWTLDNMRARIRINTRDAFDIGEKTFSDSDLLGYINDGIRFVASTDHAAYQPVVDVAIPADTLTVQLGAGQLEFVEVLRNNLAVSAKEKFGFTVLGGTDAPQGMSAKTMAATHASSQRRRTAIVGAFSIGPNGKTLTIWPINNGTGKLKCRVRSVPLLLPDDPAATTCMDETYDLPIVQYATYRALARDSEDADALAVADAYAKEALALLQGGKTEAK